MLMSPGGLRLHFTGQNTADRGAKRTSLRSPAQQLTVIPNPKPLGRKVMTNLDSILKRRDITLPTKTEKSVQPRVKE